MNWRNRNDEEDTGYSFGFILQYRLYHSGTDDQKSEDRLSGLTYFAVSIMFPVLPGRESSSVFRCSAQPRARLLLACLTIGGVGLALVINFSSFLLMLVYVVTNILYSKWLKKKPIIDCFCIALGFLLRVMVGGTIVSAGISGWMFLTVLALSLFMAFGKRRGELRSYVGGETRTVLEDYDMSFLNGIVFMCAGLTMVFYSLWSISQESNLVYSVPIVLFIVIRYLYLVFKGRADADPTTLILSDATLMISCGICGIMMVAMLYWPL